ncbi:glycosyltransferase family A protein [Microbacterium sp. NPDC057944]|uniref:glycosyltransferase family A protein n=1 Tax=Microbacterium sp. NPDC057944 TaxID=3346286 RepID=UPI0036DDAF10
MTGAPILSVVIPSYNSAAWLPSTLEALAVAVKEADVEVEVIVVDDGSDDGSAEVVARIAEGFPGDLSVVTQGNSGRFLARWAGIERARAERVLLLDSRVILRSDALAHVLASSAADPSPAGWNAHVHTDDESPLVGRFWEVPTFIFWGDYLRRPRPYDLTPETFDSAPKGTGAFLARRSVLMDAFRQAWPEGDAKLISDDTKILRWIAEHGGIRLDPGFAAIYRPRTSVGGFVRHSRDRGTLFVDSYAGTSPLRSAVLVLLVVAPLLVVAALVWLLAVGAWPVVLIVLVAIVVLLLAPVIPAALNRCPSRGLLSYVCYLPVFLLPFWSGLARGVVLHRRAFTDRTRTQRPSAGKANS